MPWPAPSSWAVSSARTPMILVSLSGRGDKDVDTASKWFGLVGDEPARADLTALRDAARATTTDQAEESR